MDKLPFDRVSYEAAESEFRKRLLSQCLDKIERMLAAGVRIIPHSELSESPLPAGQRQWLAGEVCRLLVAEGWKVTRWFGEIRIGCQGERGFLFDRRHAWCLLVLTILATVVALVLASV